MHGWYGNWGWLWMLISSFIALAVLVGLILLVVWAVRRGGNSSSGDNILKQGQPGAKEILQVRYARGEISREQYIEMLAEIEKNN